MMEQQVDQEAATLPTTTEVKAVEAAMAQVEPAEMETTRVQEWLDQMVQMVAEEAAEALGPLHLVTVVTVVQVN